MVEHRTRASEKDHHIRGPQGPKSLPLLHHQGHVQQRPDSPGSEPGLQEGFVVPLPFLIPQKGQIDGVQLQGIGICAVLPPIFRESFSRHQLLAVVVVQLPKFS